MISNVRSRVRRKLSSLVGRAPSGPQVDAPSGIALDTFSSFEIAYRSKTADEEVLKHSFSQDIFFTGVPEYRPAPGDVVIDVGAHIGTFALLAASYCPQGRVHAIEASKDSFNLLKINVALNRADNISTYHLALSNTNGVCSLSHDVGNWGHSIVTVLSDAAETVRCATLESFLGENGIATCNFMKMNCEGAEFPILLGASHDVLRRFSMLLVLFHGDLWRTNTEADLVNHLQASGFTCEVRNRSVDRGWLIATRPQAQRR